VLAFAPEHQGARESLARLCGEEDAGH